MQTYITILHNAKHLLHVIETSSNKSHWELFYCRHLIPSTCYQLTKFCVYLHDCVCKMICHHQLCAVLTARVSLHVYESYHCSHDCRQCHDLADSEIPSSQCLQRPYMPTQSVYLNLIILYENKTHNKQL